MTVSNVSVNEGSPYAVFTVTVTSGQNLALALANGTATGGIATPANGSVDYGSTALEYSLDNGLNWTPYTVSFNAALTNGATALLVRTTVVNDATLDNGETFALTATPTGGTAATGTATIKDDGTGDIFKSDGTTDPGAIKNDDRPSPPPPPPPPPLPPAPPALVSPPPSPPEPTVTPPVTLIANVNAPAPSTGGLAAQSVGSSVSVGTAERGFQVSSGPSAADGTALLTAGKQILDVPVTSGALKFTVPQEAFLHSDSNAVVQLSATTLDNQPLPPWIDFDPVTGTFTAVPPPGTSGDVTVRVIAKDQFGQQAAQEFKIIVKPEQRGEIIDPFAPKYVENQKGFRTFNEQIREASAAGPLSRSAGSIAASLGSWIGRLRGG